MWRDDFQCSRLAQYAMFVEAVVAQKLVQEKFDFPVLQAFNLNLISFARDAAFNVLDMFSEKVHSKSSLVGKFSEIYCLLIPILFSNRF